jgi:hypothetical protein
VKIRAIAPVTLAPLCLLGAALAGCSGSVGVTPTPGPPLPSPAPAYRYVGAQTQRFTYNYGYPSPQPPSTIKTVIDDTVSVSPATKSDLPPGARDVHVVEGAKTRLQSARTVSDAYINAPGAELLLYGSTSTLQAPAGGQSSTTVTSYESPQILAKVSGTWTNSPAATIDESYADGHYQDRTIAADGAYEEKGTTFASNGKIAAITILEKVSGAGSYTGPFASCPPATSFMFTAAPTIVLTLVSKSRECRMPPTPITDWYPTAPTLYAERDGVENDMRLPSECGARAGTKAILVRRAISSIDTIIGYMEQTDYSVYSQHGMPLCMLLDDDIANYYDWQGDQISFFAFTPNGKPVSTIVTNEALVLSGRSSGASTADAAFTQSLAAGVENHFFAKLGAARDQLREAMIRRFENVMRAGGGLR